MNIQEKIKIWRNNGNFVCMSYSGKGSIPVSLLQAQLLEAAETVEKLERENEQLVELGEELHKTTQRYKIEMTEAISHLEEEIDDLQAEIDRIQEGIVAWVKEDIAKD